MNEKFFALPQEKRQAILNAGYRVFSRNSYRKSPMNEIAEAAGISKSLLFHYFENKRGLYLFLWECCAKITDKCLEECGCNRQTDFFEAMRRGLRAKVRIMKRYPDMGLFVMKAYYEKEPAVRAEIQNSIALHGSYKANGARFKLDSAAFIPGLDLQMMYQDMFWATEGYLWERCQRETLDADEMERDFTRMIDFWEWLYLRKEG